MSDQYILILGQGRSGTNWLLDLLDLSPGTFCRNEPNELRDSPFRMLPCEWLRQGIDEVMEREWDRVITQTVKRRGNRDRRIRVPKVSDSKVSRYLHLSNIHMVVKGSRKLRSLFPAHFTEEWDVPRWLQNSGRPGVPVLKLNMVPGWGNWVLRNRPQAGVFHIVRHPGGFLNSWRKRYLNTADEVKTLADNRKRLQAIAGNDSDWKTLFGDIGHMSLEESELWFWRYANETIYEAGKGSPKYKLMVYEDIVSKPVDTIREAFSFCGLEWNSATEKHIVQSSRDSGSIARSWSGKVSPEDSELLKKILAGSKMENWWEAK